MTTDTVETKLFAILARRLCIKAADVTDDTEIACAHDDDGCDTAFLRMDIASDIEEAFGISLSEREQRGLTTAAGALSTVQAHLRAAK
ncbi:MAG: hypothetical protein GC134_08130 [Proteobacteria bacterium]|nr:hypothetical protein [Pseudomonadota bacterium]